MIKTMKYINLSDLAAALNIENETEFLFFWDTEDYNGSFLSCDKEKLQDLMEYIKYLEKTNTNNPRCLQRAKNEVKAINLLRTKYGITDKIFVYFD